MSKFIRHGRLALVLVVGVAGIVGTTLLVAIGAPTPGPDATIGKVTGVQAGEAITPQGDDGIQVAQTTDPLADPSKDKDKDKGKGKCPSKPCPKLKRSITD
jgi:hypothetical protein